MDVSATVEWLNYAFTYQMRNQNFCLQSKPSEKGAEIKSEMTWSVASMNSCKCKLMIKIACYN